MHRSSLLLAATLLAVAAAYWVGLTGPLLFDDFSNLERVRDFVAGRQPFLYAVLSNDSGPLGRPLTMLTLTLNAAMTGNAVLPMKLTNLVVHLAAGCLVYVVSTLVLRASGVDGARRQWIALAIAAWWLCSPAWVSTVLYVIQRMAQMSALMVLAGLATFLAWRPRVRSLSGLLTLFAMMLLASGVAALGKENGIVLGGLCCAAELTLFRESAARLHPRLGGQAWRALMWIGAVSPVLVIVAYALMRPEQMDAAYAIRTFDMGERLLSQPRAIADYQLRLLVPSSAGVGVYQDDYEVSRSLFSPPSTLFALLLAPLLLLAARWIAPMYRRCYQFGLAILAIGHLVESTILPLEIYFDHRNYLPGVGTLFAATAILGTLGERFPHTRRLLGAGVALLLVASLVATHASARVWSDVGLLHIRALQEHPGSFRLQLNLGALHAQVGEFDRAEANFLQAARLAPHESMGIGLAWAQLQCLHGRRISDWAIDFVRSGSRFAMTPLATGSLRSVVARFSDGRCKEQDLPRMIAALENTSASGVLSPRDMFFWFHLAQLQQQAGDLKSAERNARTAAAADASRPEPMVAAAIYAAARGDWIQAIYDLNRAEQRIPLHDRVQREHARQVRRALAAAELRGAQPRAALKRTSESP